MRIAIIGGGVGGLGAALALRQAGIEVSVFERARAVRAQGGAVVLWSNAVSRLRALGLERAALAAGTPVETAEFRAAAGGLLTTLPIGEIARAAGAKTIVIPRAALIRLLHRALPAGAVQTGWSFVDVKQSAGAVEVEFEGRASQRFDAVVGADGLHSRVRARLFGEEPPRPAGQVAWVGICRFAHDLLRPGVTVGTVGEGPRFWIAPMRRGRVYWYATLRDSGPSARPISSLAELAARFSRWHAPIADLISATARRDVVITPIADRPPRERWSRGRVTLLGDAAHPSTPDLGQGACQALESAVTLGEAFRHGDGTGDVSRIFAEYESARVPRTRAINELCRTTARTSTVDDPLLARLRDAALRVGMRAVGVAHLRWLLEATGDMQSTAK